MERKHFQEAVSMQPRSFEGQECLSVYAEVVAPQLVSMLEYKHNARV